MHDENGVSIPFSSVYQALSFYRLHNPARAKPLNLLEPERGGNLGTDVLGGCHPQDVWAAVVLAVKDVLEHYGRDFQRCFTCYYLAIDTRWGKDDIAKALKLPLSQVRRRLKEILEAVEDELYNRRLIERPRRLDERLQ